MTIKKIIYSLFQEAQNKNGVQYLFALLRVGPIESYPEDPLLTFNTKVFESRATPNDISQAKDFWALISNLSRIAGGYNYNPYIFWSAESDNFIEESKKLVAKDLAETLEKIFPSSFSEITPKQTEFLNRLFAHFKNRIESFLKEPKYFKLPAFEVLEPLVDNPAGLYGFRLHFSNGSKAEYIRHSKGTNAENLMPQGSQVNFMVGNLDELKPEWRVGDKKLHEIGLSGKYNDPGEWMPLIYPGNSDLLKQQAYEISGDERIQGIYFYILTTCFRAIEFVVKMSVKLPKDQSIIDKKVNLLLVPQRSHIKKLKHLTDSKNEFIYDGWLYLNSMKVEDIKEGISVIERALNGIGFYFDSTVKWEIKYKLISHTKGASLPTSKDVEYLNHLIKKIEVDREEAIDTAIRWYQLGLRTENELNAFLCFHIAIEGLAVELSNGNLKSSNFFGLKKEDKATKKKRVSDKLQEYIDNFNSADLESFIRSSYDELQAIKPDLTRAMKAVFGDDHTAVKEYLEGKDSIWSIRGKIAHGDYSEWDYEKYKEISGKVYRVQEIGKGFISRIVFQIKPGKKRPNWSGKFRLSSVMDSPKDILVASRLDMFPIKDWKIKAEWIE